MFAIDRPGMKQALKRTWGRLPTGVRRQAHLSVQAGSRAITPLQVAARWRKGAAPEGPVVVAGLHNAVIGIGQSARLFRDALTAAGADVRSVDICRTLDVKPDLDDGTSEAAAPRGPGVLVSCVNPPELIRWLGRGGARALRGKRHVGYWAWELPVAPPEWRDAFRFVDEVWCHSRFTADALQAIAPPDVPVRVITPPVYMTPRIGPDRAGFGLPEDRCVVLVALDLRSTSARKNPLGALEAYRRARPETSSDSLLVCKLVGFHGEPKLMQQLRALMADRSDIVLIDDLFSSDQMIRLVASSDVVLSLHRAEGFGLLTAEAAWLGRSVVTTGWSSVVEFLDADSASLVDWRLKPVDDRSGLYGGASWAEPDLDDAARRLDGLIRDPAARAALGRRAQAKADQVFNAPRWLGTVSEALGLPVPGAA